MRTSLLMSLLLLLLTLQPLTAQTNVFQMPQLFPQHLQLKERFKQQLGQNDFAGMEQTCRAGVALLPDDPTWRYNLSCSLARLARQREALEVLEEAIKLGFTDANHMSRDSDLATLRRLPKFSELLKLATHLREHPAEGATLAAPLPVAEYAPITRSNVVWDLEMGNFTALLQVDFPPSGSPAVLDTNRFVQLRGAAGEAIRRWQAEGSAAGNRGDLYDNRDEGHSKLKLSRFPEMRAIQYEAAAREARLTLGPSSFFFQGVPVIGNASLARLSGPFWRSNARQIYTDGRFAMQVMLQYRLNQHYVYPQHQDYLSAKHGDLFPANTPYLTIAPGSSYSDQPLLEAFAATLAAFKPEVKELLRRQGALAPTLQMLLRASQSALKERNDYLTPLAHPVVFDGDKLDLLRMVTLAHEMTTNALPPTAAVRVLDETRSVAGRDFFDSRANEALFDSPAAIARVVRGMAYTRRMVVDGRGSRRGGDDLKAHWLLLQGECDKVRITPREDEPLIATIEIDYHGGNFRVSSNSTMRSSRVDIALIVDNGTWFSPPAYITFLYLDNEIRQYDDDGAILSVDYRNARHRYTDPLISLPCNWSDLYNYDQQRRLTGWTRAHNGGLRLESFTWDGARVTARDAKGRPTKGQVVAYLPHREEDADGTELLELRQVDTRLERHYGYHSDDDQIGYIVREGVAE